MNKLLFAKSKYFQPVRGIQTKVHGDLVCKFLHHVRSTPDKLAIMTTDTSLTYQELYKEVLHWRALLAQHLHGTTLICLERTPRLLAVLLALQWLEITYIPVDPVIPLERMWEIVEDSQAQALLFDSAAHPDYSSLPCLPLDLAKLEQSPVNKTEVTKPRLTKKNTIAYIIYTSGSTGKPKGVAISHRALNNFLASMSRHFLKKEHELLLAVTTIAFDIAALELYLPLWQQKTVFLANQEQHKDPFHIKNILHDQPITLLQTTPSMWKMLESVEWSGNTKLVALCGGEALPQSLAQHLLSKVAELWNMYGPTEATIWCSLKRIQRNEPITIGHPIDNTEMRVMDSSHHILPPYVKGELYIGGLSLAEAYVNDDLLTKTRFIPCKDAIGGRLYRVGDIACVTSEGEFVIFGRSDNQIKLHGYRIELEDIEANIQTFPGIRECAVSVYREQIIAYLCLTKSSTFSEVELMNHLARYLPGYMLPKRFILLDKLPLSTAGKLDRKALLTPNLSTLKQTTDLTELTPTQLALVRIWSEELGVTHLGIHDNFFALGGHSLLAVRIVLKISQHIGKHIPLHDFYHAPTIAQLAEVVEQAKKDLQPDGVTKNVAFDYSRWLPLNDFQLMMWISRIFEPRIKKFNIGARRRVQGPINKIALDLALELVFQKQEILSYTIHRFYPAQKRNTKWSLKWLETSLCDCDDEFCETYLYKSFDELFYYQSWHNDSPMIVAKLFYLKHDQIELQVCMSHLISDENSMAIFFHDLSNAYLFYAQHTTLNAKESFQLFPVYLLHQYDQLTKNAERDAAFWTQYLQDANLFHFPEKYILQGLPKEQSSLSTYLEISEKLLSKLRQFCEQNRVTLSDSLCAAIGLSLLICCKNENKLPHNLLINTVKSTRDDPRYDNIIGCFLRIHPIKLDLQKDKTLAGLAKQAQRSTLETSEYQQASSLIKLASIGQNTRHKKTVQLFSMLLATAFVTKVAKWINLHPAILKACVNLAAAERKNNFIINVNIHNNFFSDSSTGPNQRLFGLPVQPIPTLHPYTINPVEYVLDVSFLRAPQPLGVNLRKELRTTNPSPALRAPSPRSRGEGENEGSSLGDSNQNRPFVIITSNLTPAFREYFAKTLLELLQKQ